MKRPALCACSQGVGEGLGRGVGPYEIGWLDVLGLPAP